MLKSILRLRNCSLSLLIFAAILAVLPAQAAFAQNGLTKIADNVYCYVGTKPMSPQNSFASNTGVIIGRDGIVVIDSLISAREAQRFLADIRAISDKPIKYVVTTHSHFDHVLGSSEFVKLGATLIGHSLNKRALEAAGPEMVQNVRNFWGLSEEDMAGTTVAYPTLTFTNRMEIDLGDQKIELIYPGPSHTNDSILVYLPDKKLLFTGDILITDYHPYLAEGDIPGWISALDAIKKMDVDQIIPGHGFVSGKKDIADMKEYLLIFDKKAKELCARPNDLTFVFNELVKALPYRDTEEMIKVNLRLKYLNHK